ncbi:MAG: YybH family protein [Minwuia sp.]|uniref:YybH family protein n=1 Tax=Minwuia sp. TaxID=2493630 RepID=UPI003A88DD47
MSEAERDDYSGKPDAVTMEQFDRWLQDFGAAWQNLDAEQVAALFDPEAAFFETPFGPPKRGQQAILAHWREALSKQSDVVFMYRALAVNGDLGLARWAAQFNLIEAGVRIEFDGMLECRLGDSGDARLLRLWWHDREAPKRNSAA